LSKDNVVFCNTDLFKLQQGNCRALETNVDT
jgi:hypothetical protein